MMSIDLIGRTAAGEIFVPAQSVLAHRQDAAASSWLFIAGVEYLKLPNAVAGAVHSAAF